jgi:hypothetical protein
MRGLVVLTVGVIATGCCVAPSGNVLRELVKSERSWCFAASGIATNIRISGTGIRNGKVICSMEEMQVESFSIP